MSRLNILLVFVLLVCSCKKKEDPKPVEPVVVADPAPTACFNADNYFQMLLKPINFTNCSENYERAEWNFGNGASSTISDPTMVYGVPGIYDVTLKTFKGVRTAQVTKKVISANSIKMAINLTYSNFTTSDNEIYDVKIYWRKKNESTYYYIGNDMVNHFNSAPTDASFDAPDAGSEFIFKVTFERKLWTDFNTALSMDSVLTDVVHAFNGVKTPTGSAAVSKMKANFNITMEYKQ